VTNFLNKMANEIDMATPSIVEHPEKLPGKIASHPGSEKDFHLASKPDFDPVRRKLALEIVQ
jgi:hypothetical protein